MPEKEQPKPESPMERGAQRAKAVVNKPRPLVMHPNQTTKQPVVWFCLNADCRPPIGRYFEFESDYPRCPKCGCEGYPTVQKRVLIHLLVRDPNGPVQGAHGRWRLACDAARDYLATLDNGEAASDDLNVTNCPGCLKAVGDVVFRTGHPIRVESLQH